MNNLMASVQSVPAVPASTKRCFWYLGPRSPTGTTPRRGGTGGTVPRIPCSAGQQISHLVELRSVKESGKHHGKVPRNVLCTKVLERRSGLPIRCARTA